jgi:hypothetical protein
MGMSEGNIQQSEHQGRFALVVGINDYRDHKRFCPLPGCAEEANKFGALLEKNENGSKNFGSQNVEYLLNEKGRKNDIVNAIKKLLLKKAELVVFYFSGHGADTDRGGVLITSDCRPGEEGVIMNDLIRWASLSPARSVLLVLDCCFSGQVGNLDLVSLTGKRIAQLPEKVAILTASEHDKVAGMHKSRSLFTSAINAGLEGAAANAKGEITLPLLYEFVARDFEQRKQRPQLKSYINHSARLRQVLPSID